MSVIVVGVNHRTVPLAVLERMTVAPDHLPKALHELTSLGHVREAVVLSTCNRTEVYFQAEGFHAAVGEVRDALGRLAGLAPDDFADALYVFHDAGAVAHLFTVAAGLDSMVLGEGEILGQVRAAWERATVEKACGPALNPLFRHALEVGKRVRTETGIARHTASVSSAAVALAAERLGTVEGRRVLVLGTGEMGSKMAVALAGAGAAEVLVANRTPGRAGELAERVGGRAVALGDLAGALADVDLLLTSTGATEALLEYADLEPVMAARAGRPLLVVDVAVPRDVDPGVADLDGITLLDMDDLRRFAEAGLAERRRAVARVRDLVDDEVVRYREEVSARAAAPLVTELRDRVESLRLAELERHGRRLTPEQRAAFDAMSRSLVAKLLHEPTVRLKDTAGSPRGETLADAVRDLFSL